MRTLALCLFLGLASLAPVAHAESYDTSAEDTAEEGDSADPGDKIEDGCASGGVNTGLIVLLGLGLTGLAGRSRRRR